MLKKYKPSFWCVTTTDGQSFTITALTREIARETAEKRLYSVERVETVEEYTARNAGKNKQ